MKKDENPLNKRKTLEGSLLFKLFKTLDDPDFRLVSSEYLVNYVFMNSQTATRISLLIMGLIVLSTLSHALSTTSFFRFN